MIEMALVRLLVLVALAGTSLFALVLPSMSGTIDDSLLRVTFLDVGQGDAILIQTPDGVDVLIDGGPDADVLHELRAVLGVFDSTIDMVVGTHPDKDHIGGLVSVLEAYTVGHILTTENRGETMIAAEYHDALTNEGAIVTNARAGQTYALGASTTMTVYAPARDPSMLESNTASIVVKITYGDVSFMLTGDAPQSIEDNLVVTYGTALQSDVLKLGHHGSKTSSSELFLRTVEPIYAVVSAGVDNTYGHPYPEVIERVTASGALIKSTATGGRLTFTSDGQTVMVQE